jgi:hypothetical protein
MFATGAASKREEMIHVTQAAGSVLEAEALRVGDLKLLWHPAGTDCSVQHPGWYPPPGLPWNYTAFTVRCPEPPATASLLDCTEDAPCLFNISADPCEHNNLAGALPARTEQLRRRLAEYRATAVLPWLNFADKNPKADSSNFGPVGEYDGVYTPWLTETEAAAFYPSNYSGPGAPAV